MDNIFDYLQWRGDLDFQSDNFNEVDNLILSVLSYLEFEGLVPGEIDGEKTPLSKVATHFKKHKFKSPAFYENPFFNHIPELLQKASETKRFHDIQLSGYVNQIDYDKSNQFSAVVFSIDSLHHFIAFRGTDDTLAGWKEDFQMSFMEEVHSQKQAVAYVDNIVTKLQGKFYLGGHSKGGNLAVYGATQADEKIRNRIACVFNNDGPGFQANVIQSQGYQSMLSRIYTFIPKSSIVGMLMEHGEDYKVVGSSGLAIMQHNAMNWSISGPSFVYENKLTKNSLNFDKTLRSWLNQLSIEQRTDFVDALFEIFQATGAKTLSQLSREKLNTVEIMIKTFKNMDPAVQGLLKATIEAFFIESQKVLRESIGQNINSLFSRNKFIPRRKPNLKIKK